jgi:hypothetical protein
VILTIFLVGLAISALIGALIGQVGGAIAFSLIWAIVGGIICLFIWAILTVSSFFGIPVLVIIAIIIIYKVVK